MQCKTIPLRRCSRNGMLQLCSVRIPEGMLRTALWFWLRHTSQKITQTEQVSVMLLGNFNGGPQSKFKLTMGRSWRVKNCCVLDDRFPCPQPHLIFVKFKYAYMVIF